MASFRFHQGYLGVSAKGNPSTSPLGIKPTGPSTEIMGRVAPNVLCAHLVSILKGLSRMLGARVIVRIRYEQSF